MASRGFVRPVGPLPAGVYWRRRGALVLVLLVVVLVGRAALGSGGGGAAPASAAPRHHARATHAPTHAPTPTPSATAAPAADAGKPVPTGTPAAPPGSAAAVPPRIAAAAAGTAPACRAAHVTLTAAADATSYSPDQRPRFTLTVANTGARACRVDLGTAVRSLVVYSGADRIWSSGDCVRGGHTVVTLRAKQRIAYATTWSRHRSSTTDCGSTAPAALPGTYRVSGHLGGVASRDVAFVLR